MALPVCLLVLSILSLSSSSQLPGLFPNNKNQFLSSFTIVRDNDSREKDSSHVQTIQTRTEIIESKPVFVKHEVSPDIQDIENFNLQHNSEEQRLRSGVQFQPFHNSHDSEDKSIRTGQQFDNQVSLIHRFNNIIRPNKHLLRTSHGLENQGHVIQDFFNNRESGEKESRTFAHSQNQENVAHHSRDSQESVAQRITFLPQLQNQKTIFQRFQNGIESENKKSKSSQQFQSQFNVVPHFQNNRESEEQSVRTNQQFQNQAIVSQSLLDIRELENKRLKSSERFPIHENQAQHFRAHIPTRDNENAIPLSIIRTFTEQKARTDQPFQNKAIAIQSFHDNRELDLTRLNSGGRFQVHANQAQQFKNHISPKEIENETPLSIIRTYPVFRDVLTKVNNFQSKGNVHASFKEESVENPDDTGSLNTLNATPLFTDNGNSKESHHTTVNNHMTDSEEESESWFRHHKNKFFDSLISEKEKSSENQFQTFDKGVELNNAGHILKSQNLVNQNIQSFVDMSVESSNGHTGIGINLLQQSRQPFSDHPYRESFPNSQESSQQNFEDSKELLTNHHSLIQGNLKFEGSHENFPTQTILDEHHLQSFEDSSNGFVEPRIIEQQNFEPIDQSNELLSRNQQTQGQLTYPIQQALFIRMEDNKVDDDQDDHSDSNVHFQSGNNNHGHDSESKEKFIPDPNNKHNFQSSLNSFPRNKIQEVKHQFLKPLIQLPFQSRVEFFNNPKQKVHPKPQLISEPHFQPHNSLPFKQTFTPQLIVKPNFPPHVPQITNPLPFTPNLQFIDQSNHKEETRIKLHPKFDIQDKLHVKKPQTSFRTQLPNSNLLESSEETYDQRDNVSQFKDPIEYKYKFAVHDSRRGTTFGKEEERLGLNTQGHYYVHLPDGRLQRVSYFVEGKSGYRADVQYDGKATFSKSNAYY